RMGGVEEFVMNSPKDPTATAFMVGATEFAVPQSANIDVAAEIARIEKDIAYQEGFLKSVEKKLAKERFVANATEAVVAAERKKQADALAKLETLRASLAVLK
ncbi:MAG: valine--tRNA ligase, partial [Muribaculaceae bacterium]|nr:valine--tRNA ligase [Muribaculaceae bacterium]